MKTITNGPRYLYLPGAKGKFLHIYRSKTMPYSDENRCKFWLVHMKYVSQYVLFKFVYDV